MKVIRQYKETLDYLFRQLPMFQRVGQVAMKKDLGNITQLCAHLNHPQKQFKSIHLAGTNGKGSTAHLLSAALQASGYKVGLYTSPHYKDFRERIKLNGQLLSKSFVVNWVDEHRSFFEKLKASFFEITVAMAFDFFAQEEVDVAIIETGLGGRLDSTNIILPELSIITNISLDHQQFLGNTLEAIAGEKAGIIKKEVPVVIGETHSKTKAVFLAKAKKEKARIVFADQQFEVLGLSNVKIGTSSLSRSFDSYVAQDRFDESLITIVKNGKVLLENFPIQLKGEYQFKNLATASQAIDILQKQKEFNQLSWEKVKEGWGKLKKMTRFIGRWQVIGEEPIILCDSAHNVGGFRQIFQQLEAISFGKLHMVLGVVKDKKLEETLPLFPKDAVFYFAKADIPRGMPAELLKQRALAFGLKGRAYVSVKNALKAAKRRAKKDDLIFVGGSIFVVAEVI